MIKMFGFWRSSAAFRVRMALNLKHLPYQEQMIDLDAGEQHSPAYRAINPQAALPTVFIDGGPALTQSLAILDFLEDAYPEPPLLPAERYERARVRSLALLWAADHHPLIVPRVRRYLGDACGQDEPARAAWLRHWLREGLTVGEQRLSADSQTGRFCHGDAVTLADLCLMSHAMAARHFGADFADLPVTSRIVANCVAVPAIERALPLNQPGAPQQT